MTQIIGDLAWFVTVPGMLVLVCAVWFGLSMSGRREDIDQ